MNHRMKKNIPSISYILLQIIFLFFVCSPLNSQEPVPVNKSNDKVIIDGKVYYIHIVKKGQTLYSISNAYEVSQKTISKENPDVAFGLITGQALKIPMQPESKQKTSIRRDTKDTEEGFIQHEIQSGQTLYSISRKYNVSIDEIKAYNDVKKNELKIGTILRIPKKPSSKVVSKQESTASQEDNFIYHKVKKKETLFSLSQQYNVSIASILEMNEQLDKEGLKYGQYIRILKDKEKESGFFFTETKEAVLTKDTSFIDLDSMIYYNANNFNCRSNNSRFSNKTLKIALLIPFYLEENENQNIEGEAELTDTLLQNTTIAEKEAIRENYRFYPRSFKFIEFYEGVLLALDTLKHMGINVELSVHSTKMDHHAIDSLLSTRQLRNVDFIIGPAYYSNLKRVADFCQKNRIYLVSPFSSPQEIIRNNEYVFKVRPSINTEYQKIAKLLSHYSNENIVLINHDSLKDSLNMVTFKRHLFHEIHKSSNLSTTVFKEVEYADSIDNVIEHALTKDENNVVFINSREEPFVSQIVGELSVLSLEYDITIIGYPVWKWFSNIDIKYFYNLELKYISAFDADYENQHVKNFLKKYRRHFFTEPSPYSYSFIGYDVVYYFSTAYHQYGNSFPYCLSAHHPDLLKTTIKFYRINEQGGYENMAGALYHYQPGFKITRTNFFNMNLYFTGKME